jgi:phosphohistidine phosphatase
VDLYIIRHADALPLGAGGISTDPERPLSPKGEKQARALGDALLARGVRLDRVFTSPLLRARQTAEGVLRASPEPAPLLAECGELAPGGKRRLLAKFLRQAGGQAVAVVGHQPDLGEFASWLIGSRKAQIDLAKAAVAYVRFDGDPDKGAGTLVALVTPPWYRGAESAPILDD